VVRWDVAFADLFLVAHDHDRLAAAGRPAPPVPRPWRLAFAAGEELPTLAHLLLGMNAHINYDLPQALLQVISGPDFTDPAVLGAATSRSRADRLDPHHTSGRRGSGARRLMHAGEPSQLPPVLHARRASLIARPTSGGDEEREPPA